MAQQTVVVDIALLGKMAGYIEMLVKDPHSTVFAGLSDIYRTFGLHEEAVAVALKGSEMVPDYPPGFVALGRALAEKGDPAGASDAYHKALVLDPANLAALTGLASSCLGCGKSDEALALLTQAELIDSDDEVVRQLFPIVKKLAASPGLQDSLVSSPPQIPTVVDDTVIEEQFDRATGAVPLPPIATATLADIYIKQGFPERAIKVFNDLLEEDPGNAEIRQRYDDLLLQVKKADRTNPLEAETIPPSIVTPVGANLPEGTGRDALVALYALWLDAVHRRQADVH